MCLIDGSLFQNSVNTKCPAVMFAVKRTASVAGRIRLLIVSIITMNGIRYPECNTHAPYCHLWLVRLYHISPHYLINDTVFEEKKIIEHKTCVLTFCTAFF